MQIAVFCSSSDELASSYYDEAKILGSFIGKQLHTLVYGGANKGLMEVLAKSVKSNGGHVIGVLPSYMRDQSGIVVDELFFVESLSERKDMMKEYADVFVVLPGGFGTMDELFDVIADAMVGAHDAKIIIVNTNGYFDFLMQFFDEMYLEKFAKDQIKSFYAVVKDADECVKYLKDTMA